MNQEEIKKKVVNVWKQERQSFLDKKNAACEENSVKITEEEMGCYVFDYNDKTYTFDSNGDYTGEFDELDEDEEVPEKVNECAKKVFRAVEEMFYNVEEKLKQLGWTWTDYDDGNGYFHSKEGEMRVPTMVIHEKEIIIEEYEQPK